MIKKNQHKYPTNFSNLNYSIKKHYLKTTKYSVSFRKLSLSKNILDKEDKGTDSHLFFKKKRKSKLLDINNELTYF